jgi:hypothetical protein
MLHHFLLLVEKMMHLMAEIDTKRQILKKALHLEQATRTLKNNGEQPLSQFLETLLTFLNLKEQALQQNQLSYWHLNKLHKELQKIC